MIQFDKRPALLDRPDNVSKCGILRSACERVKMNRIIVKAGSSWKPEGYPRPQMTQMILFLNIGGYVMTDSAAFNIKEPALFVPEFDKESITICAGKEDLHCIQIISSMNEEDCNQINKSHMVFPRFRPFAQAWEHTMNTISAPDSNTRAFVLIENRKLGANNMGIFRSEGTAGAKVEEDMLPTYDQFIIGLEVCDCTLTVNGEDAKLEAGDIAFVPKSAVFSFRCSNTGMIHHVWYTLNRAYDA